MGVQEGEKGKELGIWWGDMVAFSDAVFAHCKDQALEVV